MLALAASSALAQDVPALPGSRSTDRSTPQAPVGHRQPTPSDLPSDVVRREERPGEARKEEREAPSRAQITPGRGGGPPVLQVGPSCEAAGRGAVVLGRNKEACLADEKAAQDTLKQNWSKYSATDKTSCVGMANTGGPASYVELLSCVEIMRDARNIQKADALESDGESGSRRVREHGRPVRLHRRHPT